MSVPVIGVRVVRGPDWKWRNADGGEGHVGTAVNIGSERPASTAEVLWDGGGVSPCCRIGAEGAHDLRVFDSAPCGIRHGGVSCAACNAMDFEGTRWKCYVCCDLDLCTSCYMSDQHDTRHQFLCIATPDANPVRLPTRAESAKRVAKGLFPGASVVPGRDWQWGTQDECLPLTMGTILSVADFDSSRGRARDAVRVRWSADGSEQACRVGHGGQVEVQCDVSGIGGSYYPDHLPVLGLHEDHHHCAPGGSDIVIAALITIASADATAAPPRPYGQIVAESPFTVGDKVMVARDASRVRRLQQGHGGWIDDMEESLGKVGRVVFINAIGDLRVKVADRLWTLHPSCLEAVEGNDDGEAAAGTPSSSAKSNADDEGDAIIKGDHAQRSCVVQNIPTIPAAVNSDGFSSRNHELSGPDEARLAGWPTLVGGRYMHEKLGSRN